jgi:ferric-dicitrate binding protein FerR (iron transport regulator)
MIRHLVVGLLLAAPAFADDPFATVSSIEEPDAAGRWKKVKVSTRAVVADEAGDTFLTKGMELEQGVHLRANVAVAEVTLASGNVLHLEPGAELVVEEPGIIQQIAGEVYYKVKGAFSVSFGTVHCTVEGTEFAVVGPWPDGNPALREGRAEHIAPDAPVGTISVAVEKGKVRVKTELGELLVTKGERSLVSPDGTIAPPDSWDTCALCGFSRVPH